jgi:hypothetical protein
MAAAGVFGYMVGARSHRQEPSDWMGRRGPSDEASAGNAEEQRDGIGMKRRTPSWLRVIAAVVIGIVLMGVFGGPGLFGGPGGLLGPAVFGP